MAKKTSTSPSQSNEAQEIIRTSDSYYKEGQEARRDRIRQNKINWDVYYGKIDWSYKQAGQSTEHLPKLAGAAEQMTAFVKKALVGPGNWFSVDVPSNYPLTTDGVRGLLNRFLDRVVVARGEMLPIHSVVANAVKQGLMESVIILKIHGGRIGERVFRVEQGDALAAIPPSLIAEEESVWRLRIDLVPTEDFILDPTGRNLYRIHEVERDFFDVLEDAEGEEPMYDLSVVNKIKEDFNRDHDPDQRKARQRNQNESTTPRNRRRIVLREFWGTLLDSEGKVLHKNVVWTIANEKYLIRKPTPYPFWHGEDPFVVAALVQNPHSQWSKAMFDDVSSLNMALDELYNLILDGGVAKVWGVRQIRPNWLEDPRQVSGGVPQGATLVVNDECPVDGKVVEAVVTGDVPKESMAVLALTDRELNAAAFSNDIRLGNLPAKAVKATEVMEASQNSSVLVDSFAGDVERRVIEQMLRKAWFTILQFADDLPSEDVVAALGINAAFAISRMTDAERYAKLAKVAFKANGLSATLTRARDFQKFMAAMQACTSNPVMLESFIRKVSPEKAIATIFKMLNLNIEDFALTPEEAAALMERMQNIQMLGGIAGGGGGSSPNPMSAGSERSMPNEARSETSSAVEAEQGFGSS